MMNYRCVIIFLFFINARCSTCNGYKYELRKKKAISHKAPILGALCLIAMVRYAMLTSNAHWGAILITDFAQYLAISQELSKIETLCVTSMFSILLYNYKHTVDKFAKAKANHTSALQQYSDNQSSANTAHYYMKGVNAANTGDKFAGSGGSDVHKNIAFIAGALSAGHPDQNVSGTHAKTSADFAEKMQQIVDNQNIIVNQSLEIKNKAACAHNRMKNIYNIISGIIVVFTLCRMLKSRYYAIIHHKTGTFEIEIPDEVALDKDATREFVDTQIVKRDEEANVSNYDSK
jgi:hypothetical protein